MRRNTLIVALVVSAFAAVAVVRWRDRPAADAESAPRAGLPRLVELGSDSCAACKAMAPVLDALRRDHAETLDVVFIDVWKSPERAEPYGVRVIPTQVFVAPGGAELARHEGFFSADQIRARFEELGHALGPPAPARDER